MSIDPVATYVALLRSVNVGGKNKLLVQDVTAMFTLAGCEAAETYIQGGNVVFKAGAALASRIPTLIASEIEERFSYRVPVVVRTAQELRDVARGQPLPGNTASTRGGCTSRSSPMSLRAMEPRNWTLTARPRMRWIARPRDLAVLP